MKYSKSTGCFYPDEIHYPNPPSDLINVTRDEYDAAMARAPGEALDVIGGKLVIVPAPVPSDGELLDQAKVQTIAAVANACAAAITAGFMSDALDQPHLYPSQQTDQANLSSNVLSSLLPNLPSNWLTPQLCADADGVWTYRAHSAAQIQKVGTDGKAYILGCLTKKAQLQAQIEVAASVDAVQAIDWS